MKQRWNTLPQSVRRVSWLFSTV